MPCCKDVFFIKHEHLSKIKYNNQSFLVNVPQFLINLFMLKKDKIKQFVYKFKVNYTFSTLVIQVCTDFLKQLFHVRSYFKTDNEALLLYTVSDHVLQGIHHLDLVDLEAKIPLKNTSEENLMLNEIKVEVPGTTAHSDCVMESQLYNLKFAKPRVLKDPTFASTNRNMDQILQNITQIMDNAPNLEREAMYDKSISDHTQKQQKKYRARTIKTAKNKKKFRDGDDIPLNSYAGNKTDNFGYLTVTINNNTFEFLLDSGALVSFIHKDLVSQNVLPSKVKISTAGSSASADNVEGECELTFSIKDTLNENYSMNHNFVVLKDVNGFAGIIGCDLLFNNHYSMGMDFINKTWSVLINNEKVLIPYSQHSEANQCVLTESFTLLPKTSKLVKVNCINVGTDFLNHSFINKGTINKDYEIFPGLSNLQYDEVSSITSHLWMISRTKEPLEFLAGQPLDSLISKINKEDTEIKINDESFLSALENRSLNKIIESYCIDTYKQTPEFGDLAQFQEDVQLLSSCNFITTHTDDLIPNKGINKHPLNSIIPDNNSFNEFASSLDACAQNISKNVKFSEDLHDQDPRIGYKNNLDHIQDIDPNMVLPDDYVGEVNKQLSTNIGDSDLSIETYSYKDVDLSHIPEPLQSQYEDLMSKYKHIFASHSWDIGRTNLMTVQLETVKKPVSQKQRQIPKTKLDFVDQAINELSSAGVIRKASSWESASNLILVPKYKNLRYSTHADTLRTDPSQIRAYRICVDLRDLNQVLAVKCSSLSKPPEKIIMPLANRLVTNLDVTQAYFSIPLHEDSQTLTSFFVDNNVWCFRRLSQGLLISPRAFEFLDELVYDDAILAKAVKTAINLNNFPAPKHWNDIVLRYQDDSWLHSPVNYAHHLFFLSLQFYAIARSGLKLSPKKCKIATTNVKVLGLEVDTNNACIAMDILKSQSILNWPDPSSLYEVHSRLYSLLYYSKFLPKIKEISLPLQELLRNKQFQWEKSHQEAWENIKAIIILDLRLYIPSPTDQLYLFTDASKISCSSVLFVEKQGSLKIVACDSTLFNYADSLKSPFIKESISLVRGLKKFSNYIGACIPRLKVFTDCRSLLYVSRKREFDISSFNLSNTLLYYQATLCFDIYHITGNTNVYADLNSRAFVQSRLIKNNQYNLSKEQSSILPPLPSPFLINGDILYQFLSGQPQVERWDTYNKDKRKVSTPRPLTNLSKLYDSATPEERHVSAVRLLKQWNDPSLSQIDYTNQINNKIGISNNSLAVSVLNKKEFINQPSVILSHHDLSINGQIIVGKEILLKGKSQHILPDPCKIKSNVHVDIRSSFENIEIELIPVSKHTYSIRLLNMSDNIVIIRATETVGMFFSNILSKVIKTQMDKFDDYTLHKYILPVSGIQIMHLDSCTDSFSFDSSLLHQEDQIFRLNNIKTNKIGKLDLLQKAALANELVSTNRICEETLKELQSTDKFCSYHFQNPGKNTFVVKKGILYKVKEEYGHEILLTVIPECLIDDVLNMIHVGHGHPSANMFFNVFNMMYYYPKIKTLIQLKIHKCILCAKTHFRPQGHVLRGVVRSYKPTRPRESWSLDIIPRLNTTPGNCDHVLLMVDNYSRYATAHLLNNKTETSIANALKNHFLNQGVPRHIYSDSESSIISACQKLLNHFNFILQTSPFDSQFKNRAENCFKDLKAIITKVLFDPQHNLKSRDWDSALIYALGIFNNMPLNSSKILTREFIHFHASLKTHPLVYGENSDITPLDISSILNEQEISKLRKYANEDKNLTPREFTPGNIIFAKGPPDPHTKNTFSIPAKGPFKIITVDNDRKLIMGQMYRSKLLYPIPFEKVHKISLADINLELYTGFLPDKNKRDFNLRPRTRDLPDPANLTASSDCTLHTPRVTRSHSNI